MLKVGGKKVNELSFFVVVVALLSVIQTVTFRRAAGSIRPARRLHWKHRGPVVKHKHAAHIHTLQKKKKGNVRSIFYKAVSQRNRRLFIWTNNSLHPLLLFSSVPLLSEAAALMYVSLFCLLFRLFLPPASLRRLLRDILGSLRL